MFTTYLVLLAFGFSLAVLSLVLGHVGGDGHGGHVGHDGHGHSGGAVGFPLFSPAVIGSFSAAFGAGGLIALEAGVTSVALSLPIALASGVSLAFAAGWVMKKLLQYGDTSTSIRTGELIGAEGQVITAIEADGVGEVVVTVHGRRANFPARSEEGRAIARGTVVTVTQKSGATLYVTAPTPLLEEPMNRETIELAQMEKEKQHGNR